MTLKYPAGSPAAHQRAKIANAASRQPPVLVRRLAKARDAGTLTQADKNMIAALALSLIAPADDEQVAS